jgi:hypothetical protein
MPDSTRVITFLTTVPALLFFAVRLVLLALRFSKAPRRKLGGEARPANEKEYDNE